MILYESEIEQITLELLRGENGYVLVYGPELLEGYAPERGYSDLVLQNRLRAAINRLNPRIIEGPMLSKLISGEIDLKVSDEEDLI
jgi:hypothetical protein